jgi:hypothetical protein
MALTRALSSIGFEFEKYRDFSIKIVILEHNSAYCSCIYREL